MVSLSDVGRSWPIAKQIERLNHSQAIDFVVGKIGEATSSDKKDVFYGHGFMGIEGVLEDLRVLVVEEPSPESSLVQLQKGIKDVADVITRYIITEFGVGEKEAGILVGELVNRFKKPDLAQGVVESNFPGIYK